LQPIVLQLEAALQACGSRQHPQAAFECFNQALEMAKASGDL